MRRSPPPPRPTRSRSSGSIETWCYLLAFGNWGTRDSWLTAFMDSATLKWSGCLSWESPEVIPDCPIGKKSPSAAVAKVSCPGGPAFASPAACAGNRRPLSGQEGHWVEPCCVGGAGRHPAGLRRLGLAGSEGARDLKAQLAQLRAQGTPG